MKNQNGNQTRDKRLDNLKEFTSEYQPTPEAKSKGWEEKRSRLEKFEILEKFARTKYKEIRELTEKYKADPTVFDEYELQEVNTIIYLSKAKNFPDFLDRMGVRVKTQLDITSDGEALQGTQLIVNLVNELNKLDEETGEGESPGQEPV